MSENRVKAGAPARLRLRVTAAAEAKVRAGHPWVFSDSVREQNRPGKLGEFAVIYDRRDRFLALGLFDPHSPLRVRVLHAGKPVEANREWWRARLDTTLARRRDLFDAQTTGWRCIHGENDGWPGLVLDRYGDSLVLKLYTAAWLPRLEEIPSLINEALPNERVVLRLSRNMQDVAAREFKITDGQVLRGEPLHGPVVFLESGLKFEADLVRGQKTGFFLDQRENRRLVEALAPGRDVFNAFSFSGGFSLYAARGGARTVTDLDISEHALASARRNFALNRDLASVAACKHRTEQADAFQWLAAQRAQQFGLVILDPPSLAKRESERAGALGAYTKLASDGVRLLRADGVLVAASCSAHVSAEEFFEVVRDAARLSGRAFTEIETTRHPSDHPATFAEAEYLKCIYLKFARAS
ncbi:MAG: class I SAM-dependent methyltransferase [Verrucomicrobia bacterium]|nr:class I SAM-dependent methyltransferase [Verrucomicrobiota bacterium]